MGAKMQRTNTGASDEEKEMKKHGLFALARNYWNENNIAFAAYARARSLAHILKPKSTIK